MPHRITWRNWVSPHRRREAVAEDVVAVNRQVIAMKRPNPISVRSGHCSNAKLTGQCAGDATSDPARLGTRLIGDCRTFTPKNEKRDLRAGLPVKPATPPGLGKFTPEYAKVTILKCPGGMARIFERRPPHSAPVVHRWRVPRPGAPVEWFPRIRAGWTICHD